jgi:hypothetical protein
MAVTVLGRMGAAGDVPVLGQALRDKNMDVQVAAAEALGELGPAGAPAIPDLIKALEGAIPNHASDALALIGPGALPALRRALRHKEREVRGHAIDALGRIGAPAFSALRRALRDRDADNRGYAIRQLAPLGPRACAPVAAMLRDRAVEVRRAAALNLARMGSWAGCAARALRRGRRDRDREVRRLTALALRRAHRGRVTLLRPEVRGSYPVELIERVVLPRLDAVDRCFQRTAKPGRVVLRLTMSLGKVVVVQQRRSTIQDGKVELCLLGAVKRWRIPSAHTSSLALVYYTFIWGGGARRAR